MDTRWEQEAVFTDGDAFFEDLIAGLDRARHRIEFETYIFDKDALGERIAAALLRAHRRGIQVKILVDGVGTPRWTEDFGEALAREGLPSRVYRPLPWNYTAYPWKFYHFLILWRRLNRRNHRKVCVVDEETAWLGSFNVSQKHSQALEGAAAWHDSGVRVQGAGIAVMRYAFYHSWVRAWRPVPPDFHKIPRSPLVTINITPWNRFQLRRFLMKSLLESHTRAWITMAYFFPPLRLRRVLKRLAQRGTDVRLIVPAHSDVALTRWAASACFGSLLKTGVRIFEYQPSILHAKTLLLDHLALVGSMNLDSRSFRHNLEINIVLQEPASLQTLEAQFLNDLENSQELTLTRWEQRPWYLRILEKLALLLEYWI